MVQAKAPSAGSTQTKRFNVTNFLYYLGGLIILPALAWFLGKGADLYGKAFLFWVSFAYSLCFYGAGVYLWKVKDKEILGGIAFFLSLSLVPLVTYALQAWLGWWPGNDPGEYVDFYQFIKGGWFLMEVSTVACALFTLRWIRCPLLTVILYVTLWFMSQDILPFFLKEALGIESFVLNISTVFGLGVLVAAFLMDRKGQKDFAFWGYLFGVIVFWTGISKRLYHTESGNAIYCLLNLALLFVGPLVQRRVFVVFGIFGILRYLVELACRHFIDSAFFPFVLSFIGIAVIALAILFKRHSGKISGWYALFRNRVLRRI